MFASLFIVTCNICFAPEEPFWTALESALANLHDVKFAFEGEYSNIDQKGSWTKPPTGFTGIGAWHKDGIIRWEIHSETEIGNLIMTFSLDRNGDGLLRTSAPRRPAMAQQETKAGLEMAAARFETWVNLWPLAWLKAASKVERDYFTDKGEAVIDGLNCRIIESKGVGPTNNRVTLWLCPSKGWNAVRKEEWIAGHRMWVTSGYEISQIDGHWVPGSAQRDRYIKGRTLNNLKVEHSEWPTLRINYRLVKSTLEINKGRAADEFRVKLDRKFSVLTDKSPPLPPPSKDVPTPGSAKITPINDIDKAREAEQRVLSGELGKPVSPSLPWYIWLLGIGGATLMIVAGVLLIRQRGSQS